MWAGLGVGEKTEGSDLVQFLFLQVGAGRQRLSHRLGGGVLRFLSSLPKEETRGNHVCLRFVKLGESLFHCGQLVFALPQLVDRPGAINSLASTPVQCSRSAVFRFASNVSPARAVR